MYILICTHVDLRLLVQTNGAVSITIGVKIVEKVTVDKVLVSNDRVCGVRTNQGDVKCEVFVNCAGQVYVHMVVLTIADKSSMIMNIECTKNYMLEVATNINLLPVK